VCVLIGSICTPEPENAGTVSKHLNESMDFFCPLACNGNLTFEHYDPSTRQYNILREQEYHTVIIPIRQFIDAGTYRCKCSDSRERCHLKVDVIPDTVQANFTPAFLHKSYNGSCSAKGNPPPMMRAEFDSDDCNYNAQVIDIDSDFTRLLIITIPTVSEHCQNVTITCLTSNAHTTIKLNVTTENKESESVTHMPATLSSPTPTSHPGSDGISTIYSANSLTLVLAAVIVTGIWKSCL